MPAQFTPDESTSTIKVPFWEDARADSAPGYRTRKSAEQLQSEIAHLIGRLGGQAAVFTQGIYGAGRDKRYGYQVSFNFLGRPAMMQVAALPMRREAPGKKRDALIHALYTVAEQLRAQIVARVMSPGYEPLVQFMLVPGTDKTVGELVLISNGVPNLNPSLPSGDVVYGEIVE